MKPYVRADYRPDELRDVLPDVAAVLAKIIETTPRDPKAITGALVVQLHALGYRIVKTGHQQ